MLYSHQAVKVVKRKSSNKTTAAEFNPSFAFEDNFADPGFTYDPLQYAKKKKPLPTTLDEKIHMKRKGKKTTQQVCSCLIRSHLSLLLFIVVQPKPVNLYTYVFYAETALTFTWQK